MTTNLHRSLRGLLLTASAALIAGCGNLTAGGFGETTVVLSGDAPDPAPLLSPSSSIVPGSSVVAVPSGVQGPSATSHEAERPEGEVEAELTLFLTADDGDLIPLTDTNVRVRVDLEGVEEPEIATRTVTIGGYTALRMVFTEIEAEVDAGLIINGVPVTGPIDVEIDDVTLTVTKPLNLLVEDGSRTEILVDLNAASWLQAVDPATATVDAQIFADLVTVTVR